MARVRRSAAVRLVALAMLTVLGGWWLPEFGRAQTDPGDEWTALRRPLQIPELGPDGACPALPPRPLDPELVGGHFGDSPALGTFPLFVKGQLTSPDTERRFGQLRPDWDGFVRYKMIWWGHPDYDGPLLVRATRLDGTSRVRLEYPEATADYQEARLSTANAGSAIDDAAGWRWRTWNGYIAVEAPGCYAWQIDGTDFTQVVIFEVLP